MECWPDSTTYWGMESWLSTPPLAHRQRDNIILINTKPFLLYSHPVDGSTCKKLFYIGMFMLNNLTLSDLWRKPEIHSHIHNLLWEPQKMILHTLISLLYSELGIVKICSQHSLTILFYRRVKLVPSSLFAFSLVFLFAVQRNRGESRYSRNTNFQLDSSLSLWMPSKLEKEKEHTPKELCVTFKTNRIIVGGALATIKVVPQSNCWSFRYHKTWSRAIVQWKRHAHYASPIPGPISGLSH